MITQSINLNLVPGGVLPRINVSQYDKGTRTLEFTLYNGSVLFSIPNDVTITIQGTKADSTGFQYECTFEDSVVTSDLSEQMTVFAGEVVCELVLTQGTNILGTANFILNVEAAALSDDTLISDTDLPLLQEAVEAAAEAATSAEEAANNASAAEESSEDSEAYAIGTRGGTNVTSDDPAYHNNAKYYAESVAETIENLDVSDTAVAGAYVTAVSETDGEISVTREAADTTPTSGSTKMVTSGGVYTALESKQGTLTFDTTPTSGSSNPVTSGGVYTELDELSSEISNLTSAFVNNVNQNGCKNVLHVINKTTVNHGNIIYTPNSDGSISVSNTTASTIADYYFFAPDNDNENSRIPLGNDLERNVDYVLSTGRLTNSNVRLRINLYDSNRTALSETVETQTHTIFNLSTLDPNNIAVYYRVYLRVGDGATPVDNAVIYPMICLKSDYDLDPTYVPPTKTNRQLTEDSVTWDNLSEVGAVNYCKNKATTGTTTDGTTTFTWTVNDDKSVTVSAPSYPVTLASNQALVIWNPVSAEENKVFVNKVWRLTGSPNSGCWIELLRVGTADGSGSTLYDTGEGLVFTWLNNASGIKVAITLGVKSGTTLTEAITFKPMIAPVDYNGPYVPPAETNRELTKDSDLVKENLFPQNKRTSLSIYCAYDGYIDPFSESIGITKTTTLEALLRKICNGQKESGEILIATNYGALQTDTPAFLATICNDFSVNAAILYISIHVSSIVSGRFYIEVKDSGLTYIKRGYYNNFALSGNVKTQTL